MNTTTTNDPQEEEGLPLADELERADYERYMRRVTFVPVDKQRVQAFVDGEPFTSFNDGDYWDAEGFHEGANTVYTVNFESEAIARNFFACYLIGLASSQEAENWKPVHLVSDFFDEEEEGAHS